MPAWVMPAWIMPAWIMRMRPIVLAGLTCVGACADRHTVGPEAWWHETIGGKINEQRPPPPGDTDPYPNLATVPPKPARADTAAWNRMTAGLITDRINARQAAALAPIPAPSSSTPSPGPFGAANQSEGASAALVGVTSPQAAGPKAPPGPAPAQTTTGSPGGPVVASPGVDTPASRQAAPTVPPAGAAASNQTASRQVAPTVAPAGAPTSGQPASRQVAPTVAPAGARNQAATVQPPLAAPVQAAPVSASTGPLSSAAAAQRVANGQLPALPTGVPPRPNIAPRPPPPLVPLTATPPAAAPPHAGGIGVDFPRRSASLNDAALAEVRSLAAGRGDHGIAVTGYGDATSSGALEQSEAVGLGMSRAQALATALVAQGVPYAMLRLNAEAAGRGASLRLLP